MEGYRSVQNLAHYLVPLRSQHSPHRGNQLHHHSVRGAGWLWQAAHRLLSPSSAIPQQREVQGHEDHCHPQEWRAQGIMFEQEQPYNSFIMCNLYFFQCNFNWSWWFLSFLGTAGAFRPKSRAFCCRASGHPMHPWQQLRVFLLPLKLLTVSRLAAYYLKHAKNPWHLHLTHLSI